LNRIIGVLIDLETRKHDCFAFLVEAAYSCIVILKGGVSCPAKQVSDVVILSFTVYMVRNSMVVLAVHSLSAASPCEVNAKPLRALLVESVCLGVASMLFRVAFV
jgi:hypothetical protein